MILVAGVWRSIDNLKVEKNNLNHQSGFGG